jgi:hypothetical protein
MGLKNKNIFFFDLDDTIFQTKRKSSNGIFPATNVANPAKISYFTQEQKLFLDFILNNNENLLIPITARTKDQYARTIFNGHNRIVYHSIYYGGCLHYNGSIMQEYSKNVSIALKKVLKEINLKLNDYTQISKQKINSVNVDDYYVVVDLLDDDLFDEFNNLFINSGIELNIYKNEKNITLLPQIIDKSKVVDYLCDLLEPNLIFGFGDSNADLNFLNKCHFKMISHIGQLNNKLIG